MKSTGKQKHILFAILVMAFILIQSAMPADLSRRESHIIVALLADLLQMNSRTLTFLVRKCAHFTEYIVLGVSMQLLAGDFLHRRPEIGQAGDARAFLLPWGAGTLYAVTDEIHQIFVAGRSCEFRDICIDSIGVAAGILALRFLQEKRRSESPDD